MNKSIIPGDVTKLHPLVCRITAANPGMMTGPGTNTYIVGDSESKLALIDPGPELGEHIDRLIELVKGRLEWIFCTHTHLDHSPASRALQSATGAKILGFGHVPNDGRQDSFFKPDQALGHDDVVDCGAFKIRAVHTPGHASNHLCYLLVNKGLLFTGDHVMQGSTVVISPPDGDMLAYFASLHLLSHYSISSFLPGHGHVIDAPREEVIKILAHRLKREQKIIDTLVQVNEGSLDQLVTRVYDDVHEKLHIPAKRSLHAHLLKLLQEGRVSLKEDIWKMNASH